MAKEVGRMPEFWLICATLATLAACAEPDALRATGRRPAMAEASRSRVPTPVFADPDKEAPDKPYAGPDPAAPEGDQPAR